VLIHQLALEVWWYEANPAVAWLGWLLEPWALRACRGPVIALSESTRRDVVALGFPPELAVVALTGIDLPTGNGPAPNREPGLIVHVGRITPSKRVGDLVRALAVVRRSVPHARLVVVGRGSRREHERVTRIASSLGIEEAVDLIGFVGPREKKDLLRRAQLVAMCSVREGWGMAVTEANAVGTPAVVYRRPGLVDSTRHGVSGLVTDPTPAALAEGIVQAMTDRGLHGRLSSGALDWSRELTWDATTDRVERALLDVVRPCAPRHSDA
jgi:glycosyltransferase involved in cell wall biosynthesis